MPQKWREFLSLVCFRILAFLVFPVYLQGFAEEGAAYLAIGYPWKEFETFENAAMPYLEDPQNWEIHFQAIAEMAYFSEWQRAKSFLAHRSNIEEKVGEDVAFSLLACRAASRQPRLRALAYFSVSLADDAKSVKMLISGLFDSHKKVREIAARQMVRFPDEAVKRALLKAFENEVDPEVRLIILNTLASFETPSAIPLFLEVLAKGTEAEQEIALEALFDIDAGFKDMELLGVKSPGMRALMYCNSEKEEEIRKALTDRHPVLRALACEKLVEYGQPLQPDTIKLIEERRNDPDIRVRYLALRLLFLTGNQEAGLDLLKKIDSPDLKEKLFAASLVASLGFAGKTLLKQAINKTNDPFLLATLSAEMPLEEIPKKALDAIRYLFFEKQEHVVHLTQGGFSFFAPLFLSSKAFDPLEEEILSLQALDKIAALDPEHTEEVLIAFLKRRTLGLSAPAAGMLLQEGSLQARKKLKELYEKAPLKQKLEIAFVLVLFGEKEEFLPIFFSSYRNADLKTKEMIIEAVLRMEEKSAAPFLYSLFDENKARLSTLAAGAYLRLLYR